MTDRAPSRGPLSPRRALTWLLGLAVMAVVAAGVVVGLEAVGVPALLAVAVGVLAATAVERLLPDHVSPVRAFGAREIARRRPLRRWAP